MRFSRILMAFAGITAGTAALFAPTANATSGPTVTLAAARIDPAADCRRAPADVRELCAEVSAQIPYAYVGTGGGLNQIVSGHLLTHEITHGGLTPREIRSALRGESRAYHKHVLNTRTVAVDLTSLARLCGTDGQFTVGFSDDDGKPGGSKSTRVEIDCP